MKKLKQLIITCCLFISATSLVFMTTNANAQKLHVLLPTCCPNAGPDITVTCGSFPSLGGACACSQQNGECASTYTWSPTTYLTCTNCANPSISTPCPIVAHNITYTVSVNCPDGGFETDQVNVHFNACSFCSRIGHFNIDEEKANQNINVFPNPSSGNVTLTFDVLNANTSIEVYHTDGKLVLKKDNVADKKVELNLSNIAKGVYFIQVLSGDNGIVNKKILIE